MEHFIARQPILDQKQRVFAYELLFRRGTDNFFGSLDGDQATSQVMSSSMLLFGANSITAGARAFINFTRRLLVEGYANLLPNKWTVVEILETVEPDAEVLEACRELGKRGFKLALDDFVYRPEYDDLLHYANIIKVDFIASGPEERRRLAEKLLPMRKILLAEKVETLEEFQEAKDLGYHLFQGFFFSRPVIVSRRELPGSKMHHLQLLQQINQPEMSYDKLARVIGKDVALSYKLLHYVNSAAFGLRVEVTSIRQALALLGEREIRRWASLVALTSLGDDRPAELVVQALLRARLAEALARAAGLAGRAQDLFLMGLFSLLDAMCGRPLAELLEDLPLAGDLKRALLEDGGPLAGLWSLVRAQERGDWSRVGVLTEELGLAEEELAQVQMEAMRWSNQLAAGA